MFQGEGRSRRISLQHTSGMPFEGYELAISFLHGGRHFLQRVFDRIALFARETARSRVRSRSETQRDSSRNPCRKRVQNVAGFAPGTAHGSVHRSGPKV